MCRYGSYKYKPKFACFSCRKSFRVIRQPDIAHGRPKGRDGFPEVHCPQCRNLMHNMGLDFKAPRQNDIKQWKKVEVLLAHGYGYYSCGCNGPGPRPALLREVPLFLETQQREADERHRQELREARADELKTARKKRQKQRAAKLLARQEAQQAVFA